MIFDTSREALAYAAKNRNMHERDMVVFETKSSFGVCLESDFFAKGVSFENIICYMAHPRHKTKISCTKDFFDEIDQSRDIRLTFNYRRK